MGICWIALNTLREAFRGKILYLLGVFSVLLVFGSVFFGLLTIGDQERVTEDVALAGISVFGMLITVFLGVQMVSHEVRERSIFVVLARPLGRHVYVIGKSLGLFLTVLTNAILMTAVMYLVLFVQVGQMNWHLIYAVLLTLFEFLILISIAVLFSTFSTPILSSVLTATLYVIGHLSWGLREFAANPKYASAPIRAVARFFYYILPNLEFLNIRNEVIHRWHPSLDYVLSASGYGIAYAGCVMALAILIFRRRDII